MNKYTCFIIILALALVAASGMGYSQSRSDSTHKDTQSESGSKTKQLVDTPNKGITADAKRSGSPALRLPEELRNIQPINVSPQQFGFHGTAPGEIIEYDPATREIVRLPIDELEDMPYWGAEKTSEPRIEMSPSSGKTSGARTELTPDDSKRMADSATSPLHTSCKLFLFFPDETRTGFGAVIERSDGNGYHVLTAGHNVYLPAVGGWVDSVKVVPALGGDYLPFDYARGTAVRTDPNWVKRLDENYDWAVINVERGEQ